MIDGIQLSMHKIAKFILGNVSKTVHSQQRRLEDRTEHRRSVLAPPIPMLISYLMQVAISPSTEMEITLSKKQGS